MQEFCLVEKKDIFYLENIIEKLKKNGHTSFLDEMDVHFVVQNLKKRKISYQIYSIYEQAEKVILYQKQIPFVCCFEIVSKNPLSHSSILGSLYGLQISSTTFGDIINQNGKFYFFCLQEMANYFLSSFQKVGRYQVSLKEVDLSILKDYKRNFQEKTISVAANRLDTILSRLLNKSRSQIEQHFRDKEVFLNYEVASKTKRLKENDVFSVRKNGKYRYIGCENITKNGKLILKFQKYM